MLHDLLFTDHCSSLELHSNAWNPRHSTWSFLSIATSVNLILSSIRDCHILSPSLSQDLLYIALSQDLCHSSLRSLSCFKNWIVFFCFYFRHYCNSFIWYCKSPKLLELLCCRPLYFIRVVKKFSHTTISLKNPYKVKTCLVKSSKPLFGHT